MIREKIHMLHGAVGSYLDWSDMQELLLDMGKDPVAHDLYSYLKAEAFSFNQFSRSLIQSLTEVDGGEVNHHLLGYSLGGRLALHALLEKPSLWKKAMIVSAHTGLPQADKGERDTRVRSDLNWSDMAGDHSLPWKHFLKEWNQQGVLQSTEDKTLRWSDRFALEAVRDQVATSFRSWSLGLQEDLLERMSRLTVPILWVVGDRDTKFLEIAKKATDVLPNGTLHVVNNSGHRVPWEQPEVFQELVSEWFTS